MNKNPIMSAKPIKLCYYICKDCIKPAEKYNLYKCPTCEREWEISKLAQKCIDSHKEGQKVI